MKEQKQVMAILELIKQNKPYRFFHEINEVDKGIGFVLCYLEEHGGVGYANSIAEEANISRARVAVLIKKLARKEFIVKENSPTDARIDILKLTSLGMKYVQSLKHKIENNVYKIVDMVGYDKVLQCVKTTNEICNALQKIKESKND